MTTSKGELNILVIEARGIPLPHSGFKMVNPYVSIKATDNKVEQTRFKYNNSRPIWDKRFKFYIENKSSSDIFLELKDFYFRTKPRTIGTARIQLEKLEPNIPVVQWFRLNLDEKYSVKDSKCEVRLFIEFCARDDSRNIKAQAPQGKSTTPSQDPPKKEEPKKEEPKKEEPKKEEPNKEEHKRKPGSRKPSVAKKQGASLDNLSEGYTDGYYSYYSDDEI